MTARQQASNQVTHRPRPGLFVVPAEWPAGFDPTRQVSGLLMTLDWCDGRVVSEERIEHVGPCWSAVRRPLVVSGVHFLAEHRHEQRPWPVTPGQPAA
ncbi:hypothetical protein Ais01nite_15390 [Asanoa ishikariensis]|uniref:Uncharacterized protein n=1 Tax=Asanoa ishikariensis TaxID=137265 RepID=A0A1H3UHL0_9ACTN|nr:hypothetical protein [Asanoa ishikariensis]GIF63504.1 hypothetical protein Ais01nite_15390 [Asanoa ishikariensis]SDZ61898.1 hypothetical protein SAMN05421684_7334 [Asanoa ishikariensis]